MAVRICEACPRAGTRGLIVVAVLAFSAMLPPGPRAGVVDTPFPEPPPCRGIVEGHTAKPHPGDRSDAAKPRAAARAHRILRVDPILFDLDDSVTPADSAYVSAFLQDVLPTMIEIVGCVAPDTVVLEFGSGNWWRPMGRTLEMARLSNGPRSGRDSSASSVATPPRIVSC